MNLKMIGKVPWQLRMALKDAANVVQMWAAWHLLPLWLRRWVLIRAFADASHHPKYSHVEAGKITCFQAVECMK